jgi:hypothetical protein
MTPKTTEIGEQLKRVEEQIHALGPVLIGCVKKNKCKKKRKDGSIYTSKEFYYTFVYVDETGKECWKRFNRKHLDEIKRLQKNGAQYKKLRHIHERLGNLAALNAVAEKKTPAPETPILEHPRPARRTQQHAARHKRPAPKPRNL